MQLAYAVLMSGILFCFSASAEDVAKPEAKVATSVAEKVVGLIADVPSKCQMTENCQINVNFNFMESNPRAAKDIMDKRSKEIEEVAKKVGVKQFELQSYNFSLYPQNSGNPMDGLKYQVSGSLNYNVLPSEKAVEIMEKLTAMGIQSGLNVNAYRNNCMQ